MSRPPSGWLSTELQDIVPNPQQDIVDGPFGSNLKATEYTESGVPIIRLQNVARNEFIEKNIKYVTVEKSEELKRHSFVAGDIAITKLGDPLGKAAIIPEKFKSGIIVADIVRLRIDSTFADKKYVTYALNSPIVCKTLAEETKGTTRPRVNLGHIRGLPIPLAPLPEQKRIADKLDTVLARVDACRDRLDRLPTLLKRFRQSILAAATSGRLTEDWRTKKNEYGSCWESNAQIALKAIVGLDLGYAFKSAEFEEAGVRLLRGDNIEPGRLRWREAKYYPAHKLSSLTQLMLEEGDIVLAMDRPIISTGLKLARVKREDLPAVLVQRVCRFRAMETLVPSYLYCALQSPSFEAHLLQKQNGSSIPHISGSQILNFEIYVPSTKEQHEIVRRVDTLLAFADRLEARLATARQQVEQLTPALLAKAFRGELVPQDPADEPASELLKRLASQREAAPQAKRGRRKATA